MKQYNYESSPWDTEYGTSAFMKISLIHLPFMKLLPKKQSLENIFPSIQRGGWHVREETRYEAIHQVKHSLIHSPFINDFYFLINSHSLQYCFHSNSGCVQYSLRHSLQQPSLTFPDLLSSNNVPSPLMPSLPRSHLDFVFTLSILPLCRRNDDTAPPPTHTPKDIYVLIPRICE